MIKNNNNKEITKITNKNNNKKVRCIQHNGKIIFKDETFPYTKSLTLILTRKSTLGITSYSLTAIDDQTNGPTVCDIDVNWGGAIRTLQSGQTLTFTPITIGGDNTSYQAATFDGNCIYPPASTTIQNT